MHYIYICGDPTDVACFSVDLEGRMYRIEQYNFSEASASKAPSEA